MNPPIRIKTEGSPKRVLLVGWDAADWQLIHPLVERGLMPTLAGMMQRGVWGNLATIRPILSPLLWNTIATGKRPDQHGVLGFTEPDTDGLTVRPTASVSRRCKALWNILTQCGLRSRVVGWYASHPAEPIEGVMVSNRFELLRMEDGALAPPPSGSVHPDNFAEKLADLRVLPGEVDSTAILPFVPTAAELFNRPGSRIGKLQFMLSQTATIHAVATQLLADDDWEFAAVYYEGIDRFGHEFMEFHPPKMEQVSQADFDAYQHCMTGAYRFHDMMLETLLSLAGPETAVLLISDHGYYNDHLRPDPTEGKSGPVDWHRPFGVFAAQGPGVRQGSRLYGATILDIAPTVLDLLGLPAAYDMPGRVLAEVLQSSTPLPRIETWEEVEGRSGMHPPESKVDPTDARDALEQLVALGYVDAPSDDALKTVRDTIASNHFSLIQSLVDCCRYSDAVVAFDGLDPEVAKRPAAQTLLASCLLALGEKAKARQILNPLLQESPDEPRTRMMLGALELAEGRPQAAAEHLRFVADSSPRLPGLHNKLGSVYLETTQYAEAMDAFNRALAIDGDNPIAYVGRARARLEQGDPEGALEDAMIAAELVHQLPRAHYIIGRSLVTLGRPQEAREALELCVRQAPGMTVAHRALAGVYRELGQIEKARDAELRAGRILA